jgi:hypothetical protein
MAAVLAAQFLSAMADNALLFATLALLKAQLYPQWSEPLLQEFFVGASRGGCRQDAGVREAARLPAANERSRSAAAVRVSSFFAMQSRSSVMGGGSA